MIRLAGAVQGVGLRPFVHGLAAKLGLSGFVKNRSDGVLIEIQGPSLALDHFVELLPRVNAIVRADALDDELGFRIAPSDTEDTLGGYALAPDLATCDACLRELRDQTDRRYRYAFITCQHCGPRLTIAKATPFDRERTTMSDFALCPTCKSEYESPADRRFHAQTISCRDCGPRLRLLDRSGVELDADPLQHTIDALRSGSIVAIKSLGGFHLACDATNDAAVLELRARKKRGAKPFAIMVADLSEAEAWATLSNAERELLSSPARPIVLCRSSEQDELVGLMLPYTPLHHLLLSGVGRALVMTSGNRSAEPIACDDRDAIARLAGIADSFLTNDRAIETRADDSVARVIDGAPAIFRAGRGECLTRLELVRACRTPMLALGGQQKATVAFGRDRDAFSSPHLGDLDEPNTLRAYRTTIAKLEKLLALRPEVLVHDLHPGYASTAYALERARSEGLRAIAVQHHHAHMASCMVEHGLDQPIIGVTFDGTGYGEDGAIWGGEFLLGGYRRVVRAAHLEYVAMPGAEAAIREPWRMAVAHLLHAGLSPHPIFRSKELRVIEQMIEKRINSPLTSSVGRLFDAVSALLGVRDRVSYEGQAAIELETLATSANSEHLAAYPFGVELKETMSIDVRPMIRAIVEDRAEVTPALIARRFHRTLAEMIVAVCREIRDRSGVDSVVLTGGVFMNALLTADARAQLFNAGFQVYCHRRIPPNDGGLALGQLAIAAAEGGR